MALDTKFKSEISELEKDFELEVDWLDAKFETHHLDIVEYQDFSSDFYLEREKWAKSFGLNRESIDTSDDTNTNAISKCKEILGKWRKKNGRKATFRCLVEVCYYMENADLAEKAAKYVKEKHAKTESGPKKMIAQTTTETAEDASPRPAKDVHSTDFSKPSPQLPSLFSDCCIFHASLCCRIINGCTHNDCLTFFTKNVIKHELEELSISRSDQGRYLVAKQSQGSIYYIAFQAELDKSAWPSDCADMDITRVLHQHMGKFPDRFILELLRKEKKVILTGYSIGGILASALLVKVRRHCILNEALSKNLTCITFGQPHLPVPGLDDVYFASDIEDTIHIILVGEDILPRLLGILYYGLKTEDMYKFCDASQVLLQKVVAFYLKIMFRSKLPSNLSGGIMVNSKLQPAANEEIVSEVKKVCSTVEPARAIPGLNQPVTYHLFVKKDKELVREELSGEELAEHQSYDLYQVNDTISKKTTDDAKDNPMVKYCEVILAYLQKNQKWKLPSSSAKPKPVTDLIPTVTRIEIHKYGSKKRKKKGSQQKDDADNSEHELILAIEGNNLWFFNEAKLERTEINYLKVREQDISGDSVQVNFNPESNEALNKLSNGVELNMGILTSFEIRTHWAKVKVYTKEYAMSKRQQQLAKLTPSQVIEASYLCALLEKHLAEFTLSKARIDAIQTFLENVVNVVPLESLGFSVAFANSYIKEKCAKALEMSLPSSKMMKDALLKAIENCSCSSSKVDFDPSTGTPEMTQSCKWCLPLKGHLNKISGTSSAISDLNIQELYPNKLDIETPIGALESGKKKLNQLSKGRRMNSKMLEVVNGIRNNVLAVCISLLGSFMNHQEISIPLTSAQDDLNNLDLSGVATIGVWALSSFKLDHVKEIMSQTQSKELVVNIDDYKPNFGEKSQSQQAIIKDSTYSTKLRFITRGLDKIVTCNSQYVSYSLERQLSDYCKETDLMKLSLKEITERWSELFKQNTLSLVAKSHRPLIARWLKWSLMVHNLREELAKYTTVGVVGLVNSGKSTLLNSFFPKLKIPTGTTEDKRTTVPFIYNVSDEVDGLNMVDFPGVDDVDESIGKLADLLLNLAQIVVFAVDYRKAHTESCKKWLEKLREADVPVLVCFTYADVLYTELAPKTDNPHDDSNSVKSQIQEELDDKKEKLQIPPLWGSGFYYFALGSDSKLDNEEGRQKLSDTGIRCTSDVGTWLVDIFKWRFFQQDMATRLRDYLSSVMK